MEKKRSNGVSLFASFALIWGLILIPTIVREIMFSIGVYAIFLLVGSLSLICAGVFMFRLKNWARLLFLIIMTINAFMGLQGVYFGSPLTIATQPGVETKSFYLNTFLIISLFPLALSLFYFTRKKVKDQFK